MGTILIIFGIFVLYKFLVDFVIPIYKASKRVHAQFRNMQQGQEAANHSASSNHTKQGRPARNSADYIDFEEIKD